jgi:preprotein translocase subunit SecA
LRAKTTEFKEKIKQARAEKDNKIASLKTEAEQILDIDKREDIYLKSINWKKKLMKFLKKY